MLYYFPAYTEHDFSTSLEANRHDFHFNLICRTVEIFAYEFQLPASRFSTIHLAHFTRAGDLQSLYIMPQISNIHSHIRAEVIAC